MVIFDILLNIVLLWRKSLAGNLKDMNKSTISMVIGQITDLRILLLASATTTRGFSPVLTAKTSFGYRIPKYDAYAI